MSGGKVEENTDGSANTCRHDSASGIDTTPNNDPAKVWRCDHCGLRWRSDRSAADPMDVHPPIMHTGPDCSWCRNAGLTDAEIAAIDEWVSILRAEQDGAS